MNPLMAAALTPLIQGVAEKLGELLEGDQDSHDSSEVASSSGSERTSSGRTRETDEALSSSRETARRDDSKSSLGNILGSLATALFTATSGSTVTPASGSRRSGSSLNVVS